MNMKILKSIPIALSLIIALPLTEFAFAETNTDAESYKVLSTENDKLSVNSVKNLLDQGDIYIESGDFDKAKEAYDNARNLAKQLTGFYSDLNVAFRGLDARIPKEMEEKGREALKVWAEANARLVALYISKNEHEVAVPLLVEIIKLMTPSSIEAKNAYNQLLELGFVETPYSGF